ncbi:MAG: hypothetical protein IKO16_09335 [Lachnospiraceae bacterium]|nr:hypothetical protein [Lachnospiraceae bacterium]
MKSFKNSLKILVFCIGLFVSYKLVGLAVIDTDSSTRLKFHDYYQQNNIDIAVIGASRVNRGFDPDEVDRHMEVNSFNFGSSSQTYAGSYYILRDLLNRQDVETVILDVEFSGFNREPDQQKANWIISDYMKGLIKYQYIFNVFDRSDWLIMLSGICRYKDDISINWCKRNIKAKLCKEYWDYMPTNRVYKNYSTYRDRGMCEIEKVNKGSDFFVYKKDYGGFDHIGLDEENADMMGYLYKAIRLCKERDIKVVLVTFPETDFYLKHAGDYAKFVDRVNRISVENEIPWYDLNRVKDECFSDNEFSNLDHLTRDGARHCTSVICDLLLNPHSHEFVDEPLKKDSGIIGVTYETEEIDNAVQISWNVEAYNTMKYRYRLIEYDDKQVIFDSGILDTNSIIMSELTNDAYIEIFDMTNNYLGKGKLL